MTTVKIERVVSVTSEDEVFCANNLLSDDTFRKWTCGKTGEPSVSIILQLERAVQISGIDIGNERSAFIEVMGGTAAEPEKFEVLLPACSFMSPSDCRNGQNGNRVRMFTRNDIAKSAQDRRWDRLKIICSQPFVKDMKYGMSFVKVYAKPPTEDKDCRTLPSKIGAFTLSEIEPVKSLFNTKDDIGQTVSDSAGVTGHSVEHAASSALKRPASTSPSGGREATPVKRPNALHEPTANAPKISETAEKENYVSDEDSLTLKGGGSEERFPLKSVVFSLSGFQNPTRSELRDYGTELGATYSPPWTSSCTHLICAFRNTPKFEEAAKQKAIIVTSQWLVDCYKEKKMLPTDSYLLTKLSRGGKGPAAVGTAPAAPDRNATPAVSRTVSRVSIPNILKSEVVYVDPWLSDPRNCKRLIIAYGGRFSDDINDQKITVVVSDRRSTSDLRPLRQLSIPVVSVEWLQRIHDTEMPTEKDKYLIG